MLISPGVWAPVAEAIASAWQRLGRNRVTVILNVDPEICRISYGSLEGIRILQNAAENQQEALGQESGMRVCVFIVDDQTFVLVLHRASWKQHSITQASMRFLRGSWQACGYSESLVSLWLAFGFSGAADAADFSAYRCN